MPAPFHFELVSPEKLLFSGEVEGVVVSSTEGDFMVMKDHAPVMTSLRPGLVIVEEGAGKQSKLYVRGGFAEVNSKGLTILAEEAIPLAELDAAKLDQQVKDAEEDVADAQGAEAKQAATEKLEQLKALRTSLKM
jgi:F-type H+-transporting ATPase subunit epsilon